MKTEAEKIFIVRFFGSLFFAALIINFSVRSWFNFHYRRSAMDTAPMQTQVPYVAPSSAPTIPQRTEPPPASPQSTVPPIIKQVEIPKPLENSPPQVVQRPTLQEEQRLRQEAEAVALAERKAAAAQAQAAAEAYAARKAAEAAAEEHRQYLARYLNPGQGRKPGTTTVALVVASDDKQLNHAVTTALAAKLPTNAVDILTSFFKPAFITDGLLDGSFNRPSELFSKLELAGSVDFVVLGRQKVSYSANPELENVMTANMEFDLAAFAVDGSTLLTTNFAANGAGFKEKAARAMAEERLIKQLGKQAEISLSR